MKHGVTTDTTEFHKPSIIFLLSLLNLLILKGPVHGDETSECPSWQHAPALLW